MKLETFKCYFNPVIKDYTIIIGFETSGKSEYFKLFYLDVISKSFSNKWIYKTNFYVEDNFKDSKIIDGKLIPHKDVLIKLIFNPPWETGYLFKGKIP